MAHALTLVRLDLRDLAAPEPMERILDCLRTLRRGERLVALTPLYPAPLLPICTVMCSACSMLMLMRLRPEIEELKDSRVDDLNLADGDGAERLAEAGFAIVSLGAPLRALESAPSAPPPQEGETQ